MSMGDDNEEMTIAKADREEITIAKAEVYFHSNGKKPCVLDELQELFPRKCKKKNEMLRILRKSARCLIVDDKISFTTSQKEGHPLEDHSKKDFLHVLSQFQSLPRPWTIAKKKINQLVKKFAGNYRLNIDIFLADILYFGYCTMNKRMLQWRTDRVLDLAQAMRSLTPNTLRMDSVTDPSESPELDDDENKGSNPRVDSKIPFAPNDSAKNPAADWTPVGSKTWNMPNGTPCLYVETLAVLNEVLQADSVLRGQSSVCDFIAVDCEGSLELLQIAHSKFIYVLDGRKIGQAELCSVLKPLLQSTQCTKLVHDLHNLALAFFQHGNFQIEDVMDTQLVAEYCFGAFSAGLNSFLDEMDLPCHLSEGFVQGKMESSSNYWEERPLTSSQLEYAAKGVYYLLNGLDSIINELGSQLDMLKKASFDRVQSATSPLSMGARAFCFDSSDRKFSIASTELLRLSNPSAGIFGGVPEVEVEIEDVLSILPTAFKEKLRPHGANPLHGLLKHLHTSAAHTADEVLDLGRLSDIVLDVGRRPECWIGGERVFLCKDEDKLVTEGDLNHVIHQLGAIGHDNRAGLDGKLHRFSVIRSRDKSIYGLTMRIGRSVTGIADLIMDYLMGSDKSILFLGEPGSGKTTIVRDATRILANRDHVLIVDTSNEIGGDGNVPHKCIGFARRMMVESLDQQSDVMIECVQNHTPTCMVIDEIGRPKEVVAARTVKQRGVRMIASAHGDLRKLVENKELCGLVGGLETVTMGDQMAREEAKRKGGGGDFVSKTKTYRRTDPTFDIIVELQRGRFHEWHIVPNVAEAVDKILDGRQYKSEVRIRSPESGDMFLKYAKA